MKIVFFDIQGWEKPMLKKQLGNHNLVLVNKPLSKETVSKAKDADVISIFIYSKVPAELIQQMPKLKLITTRSTGFDHIDLKEAKKRKIRVMSVPTYGENTVAEHTFALILALSRKIHKSYLRTVKNDFSIQGLKGFDLKGKTIGIIGFGNIGKHVARIARGFEMNVLINDRHPDKFLAEEMNLKYVPLATLYKKSDIISLHIPYTKDNHHMINTKTINLFKKGTILINTSRGPIVQTEAMIQGLKKNIFSGIGLDVIDGEKFILEEKQLLYEKNNEQALKTFLKDHQLIDDERVVFTPHIAFFSEEALHRIVQKTIDNIKCFKKKEIDHQAIVC